MKKSDNTKEEVKTTKEEKQEVIKSDNTKEENKIVAEIKEKGQNVGNYIKDNKNIAIFGALAIIGSLLVIFVLITAFKGEGDYPILYVDNDELILWQNNGKVKRTIDKKFSTEDNDQLNLAYAHQTTNLLAYANGDSLYLYNVKKDEKEKIASNIDTSDIRNNDIFLFSEDDKNLIYTDENENIYAYNIKKKTKEKIANIKEYGSSDIILSYKNYIVYIIYEDDKASIYSYNLKNNERNKITSEMENYIISEDKNKIFYSQGEEDKYSYYIYNVLKHKNEKVLEEASYIIDYSDDFNEFIYMKKSKDIIPILDDDELNNDPVTTVKKEKVCNYSDYLDEKCTYDQWLNDETYTYEEVTNKKDVNDEIREYAETLKGYDVYYKKGQKNEKILTNVYDVDTVRIENKALLYLNYTKEKIKISSLKSLSEFEDALDKKLKVYYKVNEKNPVELNLEEETIDVAEFTDKELYLINSKNELYYVDYKSNSSSLDLLDTGIYDMQSYKKGLVYITENDDENYYDSKIANGNKIKELATDMNYMDEDKNHNLMIYNNCSENTCEYSIYTNKLKKLISDVYHVIPIEKNEYYVYKNYSSNKYTYDLYKYKNGKLTQIAFDVEMNYDSIDLLPQND